MELILSSQAQLARASATLGNGAYNVAKGEGLSRTPSGGKPCTNELV